MWGTAEAWAHRAELPMIPDSEELNRRVLAGDFGPKAAVKDEKSYSQRYMDLCKASKPKVERGAAVTAAADEDVPDSSHT